MGVVFSTTQSSDSCCAAGARNLLFGGKSTVESPAKDGAFLFRTGGLLLLPDNRKVMLSEKYEIYKEVIGTGGFGTVRKAKVRHGQLVVALKTIDRQAVRDKRAFFNEVEINADLDHPNIVKLFETFEDYKKVYLVLELCNGGEMFDKIIAQGHFSEVEAVTLVSQILRVVYYMHGKLIAHRDLKPENFLLVEALPSDVSIAQNTLKAIDFGYARRFSRDKEGRTVPMTTLAGSADYVAPEVLSQRYDEKCDMWSVGVIAFVLLSGCSPFAGETDEETFAKAKLGLQRSHLEFNYFQSVSKDAKDLIINLCAMKSSDRISAEGALHSSWVQQPKQSVSERTIESINLTKRMKRFSAANRFKKAAIQIIARRLNDADIKKFREEFIRMDTNGDGKLTLKEMKNGCAFAGLTSEGDMRRLFDDLDTDSSGFISYTEFLAAMTTGRYYKTEENCWEAFHVFDKDGSGSISLKELQQMFLDNEEIGGKASAEVQLAFADADTNGDGQISFEEFMAIMRKGKID